MTGIGVVLSTELRKLRAQWTMRLSLLVVLVIPWLFAAVIKAQGSLPKDTLFGRHMHESGFATPLVVLGFCSSWAFPLLASIVGGAIFSSEDHLATWKTLLTRSRTRGQIFTGKLLAASISTVLLVTVLAVSSIAAGAAVIGTQPLIGLSGAQIPAGHVTWLILESWLIVLVPCLAFTALAVLISLLTRQSLVGIGAPLLIGALMQLLSLIAVLGEVRRGLLTTPFLSWRGLFVEHSFTDAIWEGVIVSLVYAVLCLALAYRVMQRKEVTQG